MNVKMMMNIEIMLSLLLSLAFAPWCIYSQEQLLVGMTLVRNAIAYGAGKLFNSHLSFYSEGFFFFLSFFVL